MGEGRREQAAEPGAEIGDRPDPAATHPVSSQPAAAPRSGQTLAISVPQPMECESRRNPTSEALDKSPKRLCLCVKVIRRAARRRCRASALGLVRGRSPGTHGNERDAPLTDLTQGQYSLASTQSPMHIATPDLRDWLSPRGPFRPRRTRFQETMPHPLLKSG